MGIFDFLRGSGKKPKKDNELAEEIRVALRDGLRGSFEEPRVAVEDGTATLYGTASSQAAREKAILLAANYQGIERVNDDHVTVEAPREAAETEAPSEPEEPTFYVVQKGDSLSKIAKEHYGNASKWSAVFEANREIIQDPDKIYPGQNIRLPKVGD